MAKGFALHLRMLTDQEKAFMQSWEQRRDREKKTFYQLSVGLPLGFVFAIPIFLNFASGWSLKASMVAATKFNPMVLIIAVLGIAIFMAIFNKKYQWDMNEQRYLELKAKRDATE
jgi:hypothetical protein